MARGNGIVVSANPRGVFMEGVLGVGVTAYPGTIMQIQPATGLVGGRHTFELYNADVDGGRPKGPYYVLMEDYLQGKTPSVAYAAGDRIFLYTPIAGEEVNLLFGDIAGTAATSDVTKGDMLIVNDGDGMMLVSTGTPETEVAQAMETSLDMTANTLLWCMWTGY